MPYAKRRRMQSLRDALDADTCLICRLLREFQSSCVRNLESGAVKDLCSFHVLSVAPVTEVTVAAAIFLTMLGKSDQADRSKEACDLRVRVAREERERVQELAGNLSNPEFQRWVGEYGRLCLAHSRMLLFCRSQRSPRRDFLGGTEACRRSRTQAIRASAQSQSGDTGSRWRPWASRRISCGAAGVRKRFMTGAISPSFEDTAQRTGR
jgi:hypothetical protein